MRGHQVDDALIDSSSALSAGVGHSSSIAENGGGVKLPACCCIFSSMFPSRMPGAAQQPIGVYLNQFPTIEAAKAHFHQRCEVSERLAGSIAFVVGRLIGESWTEQDGQGLHEAIEDFLNIDNDSALAQLLTYEPPKPYAFTPEDLIRASSNLQMLEGQREKFRGFLDDPGRLPEELRGLFDVMVSTMAGPLDMQIDDAQRMVSMIQAQLEGAEKPMVSKITAMYACGFCSKAFPVSEWDEHGESCPGCGKAADQIPESEVR